ncbi:MAG: hypothetical protein IKS41_03625 [Alphaproteobacteria bacterium]|nr:hypothetical protein [Alphaproteobacteria bacterium]
MNKIELDIDKLKELYKSDLSLGGIADRMNISLSTLRNYLKDLGWKREPHTREIKLNPEKIKHFYKLGLTREDICKKLKICRRTLIKFEKESGIYVASLDRIQVYKKGKKTLEEQRLLGLKPEPRHNWTRIDHYKDDIQDLLLKGVSRKAIAQKYNVCYSTLYNFILLHNLEAPKLKKLDLKKDKIKEMFAEGRSISFIAEKLGCSHKLLEQEIKKMGLTRTPDQIKLNSRLGKQEELIKKLYFSGVSGKEIAKKVNAHPASIYRVIKKFDLVKNKGWEDFKVDSKQLVRMKTAGMSFRQIGDYFGVSPASVFYQFKKLQKTP